MEQNVELHRLEELVDKLLSKYGQLKGDYQALEEMLQERDTECAELKSTIENMTSERNAVGNRVTGLLDRIAQWEDEQESEQSPNRDYSDPAGMQGSLFNEDAEVQPE